MVLSRALLYVNASFTVPELLIESKIKNQKPQIKNSRLTKVVTTHATLSGMPLLLMLLLAAGTVAAQQPPAIDLETVGPKVGDVVPDFELPDQHGTPRKLSSLLGREGAMLVFYRSADW